MASDRGLLVSARRHPDRRLLADRQAAGRGLGAGPGHPALSRARLKSHVGLGFTRSCALTMPISTMAAAAIDSVMPGPSRSRPMPYSTGLMPPPTKNEKVWNATAELRAAG